MARVCAFQATQAHNASLLLTLARHVATPLAPRAVIYIRVAAAGHGAHNQAANITVATCATHCADDADCGVALCQAQLADEPMLKTIHLAQMCGRCMENSTSSPSSMHSTCDLYLKHTIGIIKKEHA